MEQIENVRISPTQAVTLKNDGMENHCSCYEFPMSPIEESQRIPGQSILFGGFAVGQSRIRAWHSAIDNALKHGGEPVLCRAKGDREFGWRYWPGRLVENRITSSSQEPSA